MNIFLNFTKNNGNSNLEVGGVKCDFGSLLRRLFLIFALPTSYFTFQQTTSYIIKKGENMLNIFIRVIIIYSLVLIIMRLMGKREIRTNATV